MVKSGRCITNLNLSLAFNSNIVLGTWIAVPTPAAIPTKVLLIPVASFQVGTAVVEICIFKLTAI